VRTNGPCSGTVLDLGWGCPQKEVDAMRLQSKDLLASILFVAIVVPSVGYLINGEMPFIKDPRGMSATGLALGVVTYLVIRRDDLSDRVGTNKTALAGTSLVLGIVALVLAETAAAEVLLAVFMASILIVWAFELMDHAGICPALAAGSDCGARNRPAYRQPPGWRGAAW
jgi:multisubunit Na+/H+ antiporter MnhF subunit